MSHNVDRFKQFGMSMVLVAASGMGPKVVSKPGCLMDIPMKLKEKKINKVLVTTTPGFIKRGTLQGFFDAVKAQGIQMTLYSSVVPDPTVECVEEVVKAYKEGNCQAMVAIGGGSVMDCTKIAGARIVRPNMSVRDMKGTLKINKKLPLFIAVPTTAGTGSEATAAAVITDTVDGVHYKYPISDLKLLPHYAYLDADLTLGLPPFITATTGMDALTHAVEAYTNKFASPKTVKMAEKSVELISKNLLKAFLHGDNKAARGNMLNASYYGGVSITNNFVGNIHAIAHAVGALYHIPHGLANAVIMPYVLEQYGDSVQKKLAALAEVAGLSGSTEKEKAAAFIQWIRSMNKKMGLPSCIPELKKEDYPIIIERAIKEANPAYPVPQMWQEEEFKKVLDQLLP
ncbi:MAG: iron-containing alcohol dehydrogenase [Lachnospiraceae bacterium]|nr:iron-containing alcohol dehydrogenase [Lachnospiraceae bacterium]